MHKLDSSVAGDAFVHCYTSSITYNDKHYVMKATFDIRSSLPLLNVFIMESVSNTNLPTHTLFPSMCFNRCFGLVGKNVWKCKPYYGILGQIPGGHNLVVLCRTLANYFLVRDSMSNCELPVHMLSDINMHGISSICGSNLLCGIYEGARFSSCPMVEQVGVLRDVRFSCVFDLNGFETSLFVRFQESDLRILELHFDSEAIMFSPLDWFVDHINPLPSASYSASLSTNSFSRMDQGVYRNVDHASTLRSGSCSASLVPRTVASIQPLVESSLVSKNVAPATPFVESNPVSYTPPFVESPVVLPKPDTVVSSSYETTISPLSRDGSLLRETDLFQKLNDNEYSPDLNDNECSPNLDNLSDGVSGVHIQSLICTPTKSSGKLYICRAFNCIIFMYICTSVFICRHVGYTTI